MESETICQGIETSVVMHNIIYSILFADGDSAIYAKILALNPYSTHTFKKIKCKSLYIKYPLTQRKTLPEVKNINIHKVVLASIVKHKLEK